MSRRTKASGRVGKDRSASRKGKQSKAARRRRERRAQCGHGCKQQVLMSKADKRLAEIEARLAELCQPISVLALPFPEYRPRLDFRPLHERIADQLAKRSAGAKFESRTRRDGTKFYFSQDEQDEIIGASRRVE